MKKEMTVIGVVLASLLVAGIWWKLPEYNLTARWYIVDESPYLPDKSVSVILTNHNRHRPITVQCIELIFGEGGEWGLLWVGNCTLKPKPLYAPHPMDKSLLIVRNLQPQLFDMLWEIRNKIPFHDNSITINVYTTTANYTYIPKHHGTNTSPILIEK